MEVATLIVGLLVGAAISSCHGSKRNEARWLTVVDSTSMR